MKQSGWLKRSLFNKFNLNVNLIKLVVPLFFHITVGFFICYRSLLRFWIWICVLAYQDKLAVWHWIYWNTWVLGCLFDLEIGAQIASIDIRVRIIDTLTAGWSTIGNDCIVTTTFDWSLFNPKLECRSWSVHEADSESLWKSITAISNILSDMNHIIWCMWCDSYHMSNTSHQIRF